MTTTNSSLIVERTPAGGDTDLWIECRNCGKANYLSKGPINHKRGCASSREQYAVSPPVATATAPAPAPPARSDGELRSFARNVRTYSQTKGRDEDVLAAVRAGYLSESDAMNSDD